ASAGPIAVPSPSAAPISRPNAFRLLMMVIDFCLCKRLYSAGDSGDHNRDRGWINRVATTHDLLDLEPGCHSSGHLSADLLPWTGGCLLPPGHRGFKSALGGCRRCN